MSKSSQTWVAHAVSAFGTACMAKLAGPGDREAAIRAPLEGLLGAAGEHLGVKAVFHDEVRDAERQVRPDYGVTVKGAVIGYIEVKAPARGIDPAGFNGHDKRQWERQRDLPNLIYTNGTEWRLYRDGELLAGPVMFQGGMLETAGVHLSAPPEFESLVTDFLRWQPAPITSVGALVRAVAPLTRLLRGEVVDQLDSERRAIKAGADEYTQPFLGLARDWRALLFPQADDKTFSDGYAQAVTFALLLARTEGISLARPLHEVGVELGNEHSLMGKALQLLTDDVAADFKVTLDLLVRVIGAVDWTRVRKGRRDTYLHLYENYLEQYDNDLRRQSGSYYTPREIVDEMVRLTQDVLITRLDKEQGYRDPNVLTVDPAMGTGTYLHTILERVAEQTAEIDGPGAVAGAVSQVAKRVAGFELQMGPYAVAELRTADLLALHNAAAPPDGIHLYVTDTLDDPHAAQTQIGSGLQLIAQSRRKANNVKATSNVTVVIGNPPYRERAEGMGGWVENGSVAYGKNARGILDDFRDPATAKHFHNLKNLYVYFWRWATWKVWESTITDTDGGAGVVCFISTSGYLGGPGFTGMREYLRRHASEGWIIDLTPEGQTPDIPTRIFPGVRQPLAIGLFIRKPDTSDDVPATIHYRAVHGRQAEKFEELRQMSLDDAGWRDARTEWTAPFTAAAEGAWDAYPALGDLMPWTSPGVTGNRRWPYGPSPAVLRARWQTMQSENDDDRRAELFKETRDRTLIKVPKAPLPGVEGKQPVPLAKDRGEMPAPIRIGYRSLDRQWLIPDTRVLDMPRPDLWAARVADRQLFVIEQHSQPIDAGPGLVFTALIPDLHHFNGRGGRALPLLHPDSSPNVPAGLLAALSTAFERDVTAQDLLAYIAGIVAHPAYTKTFADQLNTPGIRIPMTSDPDLFDEAATLGRKVIWAHTYGETYFDTSSEKGKVRYPHGHSNQPLALTPITTMPSGVEYDEARGIILLGDGEFGPVRREVWDYAVGGKGVVKSWVNYRKAEPGGKKTSPLDHIHVNTWDPDWTTEFIDLLTILNRLVELEPEQAHILDRILAGPILTTEDLRSAGVRWPTTPADREPNYASGNPATFDQQPTLGF